MSLWQSLEEPRRCLAVSSPLQKHLDHFTGLIGRMPERVLVPWVVRKISTMEAGSP
jgi:hypothetical protein